MLVGISRPRALDLLAALRLPAARDQRASISAVWLLPEVFVFRGRSYRLFRPIALNVDCSSARARICSSAARPGDQTGRAGAAQALEGARQGPRAGGK